MNTNHQFLLRPAIRSDQPAIESLLSGLQLPIAGVNEWIDRFWVAESGAEVVGVAGVELYGDAALLRSVAVAPSAQSSGIGRALVTTALDAAREAGAREVFLLTTTAERYFPKLGFAGTSREQVPQEVRGSVEFREACPASAVVMRKALV